MARMGRKVDIMQPIDYLMIFLICIAIWLWIATIRTLRRCNRMMDKIQEANELGLFETENLDLVMDFIRGDK